VSGVPHVAADAGPRVRPVPVELVLIATVILWSLDFTTQKYSVEHGFMPMTVASIRFLAGGIFFVAVLSVTKRAGELTARGTLPLLLAASAAAATTQACISLSLKHAPASLIALLFGSVPAIVVVLSAVLGRASGQTRRRRVVATAISFGGVACVVAGGSSGVSISGTGVALGMGAAFCWALHAVAVGGLTPHMRLMPLAAGVFGFGALPLTAAGADAVIHQTWSSIPFLSWAAFVYGLTVTVVVSNLLWFSAIGRVGAERAALFGNLSPFVGAVLAVVLLSERLTALQVVGGVLLAAGIVAGSRYADSLLRSSRLRAWR